MAVLHEAQQGSVQVGPQGILVLPSVQHSQKPSEEVQRCCWDLPACNLGFLLRGAAVHMCKAAQSQKQGRPKGKARIQCMLLAKHKRPSSLKPDSLFPC